MSGIEKFLRILGRLENNKLKKLDSAGKQIEVEFVLNAPATDDEIAAVEARLGRKLPKSYVEFLKKFNGGRIFDYEGIDGFVILGTGEIERANKFVADSFEEDWIESILVFGKYIGEGNYLGFDSAAGQDEYCVVDCFLEELPESWEEIAGSFDEFLGGVVESEGRKYWLG